jgi:hypothetical protein
MRHIARLAAVGITAVALAACGSSSSSSSSTGTSSAAGTGTSSAAASGTTTAGTSSATSAFATQATAICKDVNARIAALPKLTQSNLIKVANQESAITGPAVARVQALTPPADKKATFEKWASTLKHTAMLQQQLLAAIKSGNNAKVQVIARQGNALNAQGNADARALGLPECAKDVSPGATSS